MDLARALAGPFWRTTNGEAMVKTEKWTHAEAMIRQITSYIPSRMMYVAAKLGLADEVGDEGASAQDVAKGLNVDPDALYRVMRTLAALGVLHQDKSNRFFVTQFGQTLRKDSAQSVRDYAIYSHESTYERIGELVDSVRRLRSTRMAALSSRGGRESACAHDSYRVAINRPGLL
jgi:hypothetical protein